MIFSPEQQIHSSNLQILKIIFSPDQNFYASENTLFKRELQKKSFFFKKRCSSMEFLIYL